MKTTARKGLAFFLALVLSITVLFPVLNKNTVKTAEAASTSTFEDLNQSQIVAAMGAGWNLGNQLEATNGDGYPILSGTGWTGIAPTAALFKAVKNAGFDTVRIPVSYLNYIEGNASSGYYINSSWMAYVKSVVQMAIDADLYVIVNMHGDGYESVTGGWLLCGASDQSTIRTKFAGAWKDIANNLKDFDEHLIFEAMNEEYKATDGGGWLYDNGQNTSGFSTAYANIEALNQIFVDTVRQTGGNNAKRWLMVAGWDTNIDLTADSTYYNFTMPTDNYRSSSISSSEKRLMASVHYYTPWDFCGDGTSGKTQWGKITTDSSLVGGYGWYSSSNNYGEDYLEYEFDLLKSKFTSQGYPVVIGEYGSVNKNNETYRAYFARRVCEESKDAGCVPVIWDNNGSGTGNDAFQIIDRSTNSIVSSADEIVAAIKTVYPTSSSSSSSSSSGSSSSSSGSSSSSSSSTLDGTYYIKSYYSGLYLDIDGGSSSNNANLQQYSFLGTSRQKFKLVSNSSGYYYIYTGASSYSKVLDVAKKSKDNGANIAQYSYNGGTNQQFEIVQVSSGVYAIKTRVTSSASCLDVYGWSNVSGGNIAQYEYWGGACQLWILEAA